MPRKRTDPRLVALLDKQAKLRQQFERDFSRLLRITHRLEKARRSLGRLACPFTGPRAHLAALPLLGAVSFTMPRRPSVPTGGPPA